jgi:alpha-maltose-1-phosphate synthase
LTHKAQGETIDRGMKTKTTQSGSVIVVNPGVQPELQRMAEGLHRAGQLQSYVTAFGVGKDWSLPSSAAIIPDALKHSALNQINRRAVAVPEDQINRTAKFTEAAFLMLQKRNLFQKQQQRLISHRNRRTQLSASKSISSDTRVVVGRSTSSLNVFKAARDRDLATLLDYPIAHHHWANGQLQHESIEFPEFRETLKLATISESDCLVLDHEIREATNVLAFNDFHAQTFIDAGVAKEKVVIQSLGVDLDSFYPPAKPRHRQGPFRVIFVGQLSQRKGIGYALRAFQEANLPNAELVFVGRPIAGAADVLRRDGRVICLPHVDRRKLAALYHSADVFLFPSIVEGFAQTPLEAMACGVPIITSANAVGHSLLQDSYAEYLTDPRDVVKMSELLRRLYFEPMLGRNLSIQGIRRSRAYDNRTIATKLADVAMLLRNGR